MKKPEKAQKISGKIISLNISPKGAPESFLLATRSGTCQINLPKGEHAAARFVKGAACSVMAQPAGDDDRPSAHPVYELREETQDEGEGIIERINFARHGAPNGVVLKDGVFLHMKPEGAKALALKPGQKISYEGERRRGHGGQVVIEAEAVNGKKLAKKPEKKKKH